MTAAQSKAPWPQGRLMSLAAGFGVQILMVQLAVPAAIRWSWCDQSASRSSRRDRVAGETGALVCVPDQGGAVVGDCDDPAAIRRPYLFSYGQVVTPQDMERGSGARVPDPASTVV